MLASLRAFVNSRALTTVDAGVYFMSINKFKPGMDRAQINKVIPLHREWAKKQLAAGVIVQNGKWGDNGGLIVVKAESREEADKVVNQEPLVEAGLITFETAELHPAVVFKLKRKTTQVTTFPKAVFKENLNASR